MPEAIAFIYDPEVVKPVLPTGHTSLAVNIEIPGRDLVRTQWVAGDFDFTLVSAHLAWGSESDRDAGYQEIESILSASVPSDYSHDPDIIVLGDFNRFGKSYNSVDYLDYSPGKFLAPNVTIFDPLVHERKSVTVSSIQGKGIPNDDPQLVSTTVAKNRYVYDMFLLSTDVNEEYPGGDEHGVFGTDFGVICFDEVGAFGAQSGATSISSHNTLKNAYSDHRPLWMRFHTGTGDADATPEGLDPIAVAVEFVGTASGKRFHLPGCRTIKNSQITERWPSREDALAERRPCGICKP